MGHRDSSASDGGAGGVRAAGGGTGATAALHSEHRAGQLRRRAENVSLAARALLFAVRVYQAFFRR